MRCIECREQRKDYFHGTCRRCYTKRMNRRSFDKLADEFRPASTYNSELFLAFVSDFEGRYIKNSDLPVAKRLSAYLAVHPVKNISSWADVYALSESAGIRYTNHQSRGCAFLRIGKVLGQQGKLETRRDARIIRYRKLMASFTDDLRPIMEEFYRELASGHQRTTSSLKILNYVQTFIDATAVAIPDVTQRDAQEFLNGLRAAGVSYYTEHVRSLTRFFTWATQKGICHKNPFSNIDNTHLDRVCSVCRERRRFWDNESICGQCYRHGRFKEKFETLTIPVKFNWDYNQHLFALYLKYIHRYQINSRHLRSTKLLIEFMQTKELRCLKSWSDVKQVRGDFLQFHQRTKIEKGCPVEKIAYVLQELGVLPIREEDHAVYLESALKKADADFRKMIKEYLRDLRNQRRSVHSLHATFGMIHDFHIWLKTQDIPDIFIASEELARHYLLSHPTCDGVGILRRVLDKFYRWAILKRLTIFNPFAKIESIKRQPSLEICSKDAIKKIERFIKNSKSDPEGALILCLIFYFGFTAIDLAMANLDINAHFVITLHRQPELTYAHNMHKRDQVLILPKEPAWLLQLQKRYLELWQQRYKKIKRDFPLAPLILHADSRHGRHLRTLAIQDRVKAATQSAVGFEIPIRVVRRTGAHVYSNQVDAAILTEFGWSKDYAFDFVWRQRRLFTPKKK